MVIVGILMILLSSVISELLGGFSTPYVPSIVALIILIGAIIFFYGLKKSSLDIRENIFIILILFFSALLSSIYLVNIKSTFNIFELFRNVILVISCVISLIYVISQIKPDISLKNKLSFIGDKSKFCCLGIMVIFIILTCLGNMTLYDSVTTTGHVELEDSQFSIVDNGGKVETGRWVVAGTNATTKTEYEYYDPTVKSNIKFNIDDIEWDTPIDEDKFKKALSVDQNKNIEDQNTIIKLYDKDGNYMNKFESVPQLHGKEVIITTQIADSFDKAIMDKTDVKYIEVEMTLTNSHAHEKDPDYYNFVITSNKYELT